MKIIRRWKFFDRGFILIIEFVGAPESSPFYRRSLGARVQGIRLGRLGFTIGQIPLDDGPSLRGFVSGRLFGGRALLRLLFGN